MNVINTYFPNYRSLKIHESSPVGRGVSAKLSKQCKGYSYSHFFKDVPPGARHPQRGDRCENLEALTFADESFDLIITQDVMEHVFHPDAAFREIARVLKPGGAHVFTVPIVQKTAASRRRAELAEDGTVRHLEEAQYHGSPVDPQGSLVTMDWGFDIVSFIHEASGLGSHITTIDDIDRGIRAEFIEVIVSRKPARESVAR